MTEEWKIERVNIPGNFVVQARESEVVHAPWISASLKR